jgi:hypothetical protein
MSSRHTRHPGEGRGLRTGSHGRLHEIPAFAGMTGCRE